MDIENNNFLCYHLYVRYRNIDNWFVELLKKILNNS